MSTRNGGVIGLNPKPLLFFLACLVLCQLACTGDKTNQSAPKIAQTPPTPIPLHKLNDKNGSPTGSLGLFIVVGDTLTERSARTISNYYERQYPSATVLYIEFFCDSIYARHSALLDPSVTDAEYRAHLLYESMTGTHADHFFYTPKDVPGMATACKGKAAR